MGDPGPGGSGCTGNTGEEPEGISRPPANGRLVAVPMDAEVAWLLPDGPRPYWRGHIEAIDYEFAR